MIKSKSETKSQYGKYICQLIGEENLPENQQLVIFIAEIIKNGFLIQNAFDDIDNFTKIKKLLGMIKIILLFFKESKDLLKQGFVMEDIRSIESVNNILRMNRSIENDKFNKIEQIKRRMLHEIASLKLIRGVL